MDIVNLATIVGAIIGAIVLLGLLVAGAGFLWQSFRSGKNQVKTEVDGRQEKLDLALKDLVDVQEKRYLQLDSEHKENIKQIGILTGKIDEQAKQQKWFENIFISALTNFFKENPDLANDVNDKINQGR